MSSSCPALFLCDLSVDAHAQAHRQQRPKMGDVDDAERAVRDAKGFGDKAENSVRDHVNRVYPATARAGAHFASQHEKKREVKRDLQLARRETKRGVRNERALAATRENAVHPRAEKRENEAGREHIEYLCRAALAEPCAREVEERHEEHRAEEAHASGGVQVAQRLDHGEGLDGQQSDRNVQRGHSQRCSARHREMVAAAPQPPIGEYGADRKQCRQRVAGKPRGNRCHIADTLACKNRADQIFELGIGKAFVDINFIAVCIQNL